MYRIWYSTESFADYIIKHTLLRSLKVQKSKLNESDANKASSFHTVPDHIKKILYLDAPDIIIEKDNEPILSIEESKEAGTGHNAFQRFARIAAAVENGVPAFYIYPEAVIVVREGTSPKWDVINPLVFKALDSVMSIYQIPAFLFFYPSDYKTFKNRPTDSPHLKKKGLIYDKDSNNFPNCPDAESEDMREMFGLIDEIILQLKAESVKKVQDSLLKNLKFREYESKMREIYYHKKNEDCKKSEDKMSPLSATLRIPTEYILNCLSSCCDSEYAIGELLRGRDYSVVYQANARFRGDPYPGALAAIDYMTCRQGKTFEDRKHNLIMVFGNVTVDEDNKMIRVEGKASINDFCKAVQKSERHNLLSRKYAELKSCEIPRYYMQVRYGSTYSKVKHIRVYSYFADAIIFHDGALWRDA